MLYGTAVLPSAHIARRLWHNSATQRSHSLQSMAQHFYLVLTLFAVYGTTVLPSAHIARSLWHNSATQRSHRSQSMAQQCYLSLTALAVYGTIVLLSGHIICSLTKVLPSAHIVCSLWHNSPTQRSHSLQSMAKQCYLALKSLAVYDTTVLPSAHIACILWHNSATQLSYRLMSVTKQCYLAFIRLFSKRQQRCIACPHFLLSMAYQCYLAPKCLLYMTQKFCLALTTPLICGKTMLQIAATRSTLCSRTTVCTQSSQVLQSMMQWSTAQQHCSLSVGLRCFIAFTWILLYTHASSAMLALGILKKTTARTEEPLCVHSKSNIILNINIYLSFMCVIRQKSNRIPI